MHKLTFARHLARLFELYQVDCVLDVGANVGQYYRFLREQVEYKGLVVAFEPVPDNVAALKALEHDDEQLIVCGCALGDVNGSAAMYFTKDSCFTSFLKPDHSHTAEFVKMNVVDHIATVSVQRLDDLLPRIGMPFQAKRYYLKMDTQGSDLKVIAGAETLVPHIVALQSEMSICPIYEGMPTFAESLAAFARMRFDITGMYPVSRDSALRMIEFDCVMVNNRYA